MRSAMGRGLVICSGILLAAFAGPVIHAQAPEQAASPTPPAPTTVTSPVSRKPAGSNKPSASQPTWQQLSSAQQEALSPLAGKWQELGAERKRKWLELSKNFHNLPPGEQAKIHSRMSEWVALSQQQRTQARLNYVETKKLSPQDKAAQWQAYQELSAAEKKQLAAKAPVKPAGVAVIKPAATAKKLTQIPVPPTAPKSVVPPTEAAPVQAGTLLPQAPVAQPAPAAPASPPPTPAPAPATEGASVL
jgi:hypothetical protein